MGIVIATVVIVLVQMSIGFVILGKIEKIEQGLKSPAIVNPRKILAKVFLDEKESNRADPV